MRKILVGATMLLLASYSFGLDKPSTGDNLFKALCVSFEIGVYADYTSTQIGLHRGVAEEANPFARWFIYEPKVAFLVCTVVNKSVAEISRRIYKKNKTLGFIFVVAINLAIWYVVYDGIRLEFR